jgi:hypothetical protein
MKSENTNPLASFYTIAFHNFKVRLGCFSLFHNRIAEGKIYNSKFFSSIDIGSKHLIFLDKKLSTDTILLKVSKLESILNNIHCDYSKFKKNHSFKTNWSLIKKAFINKCILRGIVLNKTYNGFSVGVCGFVGFLPKKFSVINKYTLSSVFVVTSIDQFKNSFSLSQNRIDKVSLKVLFRLSSRLSYILKN